MTSTTTTPNQLLSRMLDWLRGEGIEPTEVIIRHVLGIVKSLETQTKKH